MRKKEKISSFLGVDTEFEGKLTTHGTIRIDGQLKGEILAHGALLVGEEGTIEADIHAAHVIICGEVHGNITADERIEIHPPGKVFGNIQAPTVVIKEGVIFEGTCRKYEAEEGDVKDMGTMSTEKSEPAPLPFSSLGDAQEERITETNL